MDVITDGAIAPLPGTSPSIWRAGSTAGISKWDYGNARTEGVQLQVWQLQVWQLQVWQLQVWQLQV